MSDSFHFNIRTILHAYTLALIITFIHIIRLRSYNTGVSQSSMQEVSYNTGVSQSSMQEVSYNTGVSQSSMQEVSYNTGVSQSSMQEVSYNTGVSQSSMQEHVNAHIACCHNEVQPTYLGSLLCPQSCNCLPLLPLSLSGRHDSQL